MNRTEYHLGLIGYPLDHSRSPALHQSALAAAGLAGDYSLFSLPPTPAGMIEIGTLLQEMRRGCLHGLNVTIPHKQNVADFLDQLTPVAAAVGAVNTIFIAGDGQLTGDNTDVPGFLHDLNHLTQGDTGQALVLGAGGSARAVVYGLAQTGWQVTVCARREAQAADLTRVVGQTLPANVSITYAPLSIERLAQTECDLLVNTTPLGMYPHKEGCPWPDSVDLPSGAAVYDLVYNPSETILLARARAAGRPALNGAGMLAAQAALAFNRWTGIEPPFEVMQAAMQEQ